MSSDDVSEMHAPCLCGKGEIVVVSSSPDHPWAKESQTRWSGEIRCADCSSEYALYHHYDNERLRLVRRADLDMRLQRTAELRRATEALDRSPEVRALIDRLTARVEQEPSMAAKYRLLHSYGLVYESIATFRRNFKGVVELLRYTAPSHILDILALLGEDNPRLAAEARRLKEISDLAHAPIPTVARPTPVLGR